MKGRDTLPEWLSKPSPSIWKTNNYLVLDFEVTNLDKGSANNENNNIVLACWQLGSGHPNHYQRPEVQVQWGGIYDQGRLLEDIRRSKFIVAHNSKFELSWLKRCGVPLNEVLAWCTQIGEYVRLGNRKERLSLDSVARRYGLEAKDHLVSILIQGGVCPSEIPRSLLERYCKKDVDLAHKVFLRQRDGMERLNLLSTLLTRNLVTPCLVDIENRGLYVSGTQSSTTQALTQTLSGLQNQITELTGGINHNSPKQIGEYLYDVAGFKELIDHRGNPVRTDKGGRKTGKEVIRQLKAETEEQKKIKDLFISVIEIGDELEFQKKLERCRNESSGILRANINQTVTQTHRLSSTGARYKIQFQNIKRERKAYFGPRNGDEEWGMFEADFSQLEYRVAGHMGRDKRLLQDTFEGFDIHGFGAEILGISRQAAKEHTFAPLYGKQSGPERLRRYYEAFRERYPELTEVQKGWTYEVLENKKLRIETDTVFYWPDCNISPSGYIKYTPSIYNYPIQSMATADIVPIGLTYLWHYGIIHNLESFVVNTVHDSGIFEVYKPEKEIITKLAIRSFTEEVYNYLRQVYDIDFYVPLGVGLTCGDRWSLGEEIKVDKAPGEKLIIREGNWNTFVGV